MPNHSLSAALKQVFLDHGKPVPREDPEWILLIHTQVLQMEIMENMMSTLQQLSDNAKAEAAALVDLNTTVTALPPINTTGSGNAGSTFLTPADQSLLDTANDTITSNIAKIGEIKTALAQPAVTASTQTPSTTPATAPASSTPVIPPNTTPSGGPPQS